MDLEATSPKGLAGWRLGVPLAHDRDQTVDLVLKPALQIAGRATALDGKTPHTSKDSMRYFELPEALATALERTIVPAKLRLLADYSNYQLSAPTALTVWPATGSDFFMDCFVRVTSPPGGP